MKKYFLSGFFSILYLCSAGQVVKDNKGNTLLWRISGKGLAKPSYLYGTMHLMDKKVFQLGDSVYKAIEQTDGFAAELDMNKVGNQMVNHFLSEKEARRASEPVKLKDAVSAETWNHYKGELEKKFGKAADKITVNDLEDLENQLQSDMFKKGDMPTFLDAWLSGQARKQGKWVGGIEDLEDQLEHIGAVEEKIQLAIFDDEYFRKQMEWLIRVYADQRLDSIDAMMYRGMNGGKDFIMIKRNLKMSRRMDSLAAVRSTLFAVGAAHLPGDSVVISLLRSRGYTVTPVYSSKKISADKYVSKGPGAEWVPVKVTDSIYGIMMPGEAEKIGMFESMGLEMKMYFDISYMRVYFTANIPLPENRRVIGYDSLYAGLRARYSKGNKVLKDQAITVNEISGREFVIEMEDGVMKMQVFIPQMETVIMNAVFAFNEKGVKDPETEKFFQSFSYHSNRVKKPAAEKQWAKFNYPAYSFSVEMPMKPKEVKDVVSDEGKINFGWQLMDVAEQVFYGMNVSSMKEGMFDSAIDEELFENMKEHMRGSFENAIILDSGTISVSGYPGYHFTVTGKSEGEEVVTRIRYISRGGLTYYYFVVYAKGSAFDKNADRYLQSFSLDPYTQPAWASREAPDKSFTTSTPYPIRRIERDPEDKSHPGAERFIVYDSSAYVTSYVDRTILPEWLWFSSDTAFLASRAADYYGDSDSLAGYTMEANGEVKSVSFSVIEPGDNLAKQVRLILHGNELYELFGHYAISDLPGNYDRFFRDFRVKGIKTQATSLKGSADALSNALKNADEHTMTQVKTFWSHLPFTAADIPALRSMMLRIYPDFDTSYSDNLNGMIANQLRYIDSNYSSVPYFSEQFAGIAEKDEYVKPLIIGYFSAAQTKESFAAIRESLKQSPIRIKEQLPYFNNRLYDSLELTATLYPDFLEHANSRAIWHLVSGTATSLLDSGLISPQLIREKGSAFCAVASRLLEEDAENIEDGSYYYTDLIRLLGIVNTAESKSLLTKFSKMESRHIRFNTLLAMLACNMQADSKTILTLATTDEYRHDLYDELKKINKLSLFPKSYLSQQQLAQSRLYEYASEEDPPLSIVPVGSKTMLYKGKQQKFYLFKISYDEGPDAEYYLGVAGPYDNNAASMSSSHDVTGMYWDEEFDAKNKDKQLEAYLKSLEIVEE